MRLSRTGLALLLAKNAVELRFKRRIYKLGFNDYRRMLCTKDFLLLQSVGGKNILNYKPPTGTLKYDPAQKNLIVAWDIFMQNWRMINCNDVDVVAVVPTTPPDMWWKYFNEKILPMATNQKAVFMNT